MLAGGVCVSLFCIGPERSKSIERERQRGMHLCDKKIKLEGQRFFLFFFFVLPFGNMNLYQVENRKITFDNHYQEKEKFFSPLQEKKSI